MNSRYAVLLACGLLPGCGGLGTAPGEGLTSSDCLSNGYACIRVENTSDVDFDSFVVHFPDQVEEFGHVAAGRTTAYRNINRAYRYAYTEAFSGKRKFLLQPIDFVGEKFVPPGIYTYQYRVNFLDQPRARDEWVLHGFMKVKLKADRRGH